MSFLIPVLLFNGVYLRKFSNKFFTVRTTDYCVRSVFRIDISFNFIRYKSCQTYNRVASTRFFLALTTASVVKERNGLIRDNISHKFFEREDSIKRWKSTYLESKELEEASGYFLSRHPSEPRHVADTDTGTRPRCHFSGILSRHLQNYRGPPSVLQFPRDSPVIRGGYLFSDTGERTRPQPRRDWLRREIHRRHPGVLYRYSLHTYRRRARDFEANVLNALPGPRAQTRHLYFAEEDHTFIYTVSCLRKGIYFDFAPRD